MKRISPWNSNSTGIAIALFVAVLAVGSRGVSADPGAADLVREAAAICRRVPTERATVGKSDGWPEYDRLIRQLNRSMLSDLKRISDSEEHTRLERRIAQILCRRIEHPEEFEKVEPFLTPVESPTARLSAPLADGRPDERIGGKPIEDPDLFHPELRSTIEKNRELYDELRAAALQMWEKISDLPDRDETGRRRLYEDFDQHVEQLKRQYRVQPGQAHGLELACGGPIHSPRLDPKYLLAWEEALCRASSPDMKASLLYVVRSFSRNDFDRTTRSFRGSDSVPVVAACLLAASKAGDRRILVASLTFLLMVEPTETAVEAISTSLDELQGWVRSSAEREVELAVSRSPRWQTFLQQMKADPKWSAKADRLLRQTASTTAPGD